MRVKHRVVIRTSDACFSSIMNFLNDYSIKYEIKNSPPPCMIFEPFEDHERYEELVSLLKANNVLIGLPEAVYSQQEIDQAEWMTVRSTWRVGYPYPMDVHDYRYKTYDGSEYCKKCHKIFTQTGNFHIVKKPNWNTKHFYMLNWVHDELFCTNKAEAVIRDNGLTGCIFYDVLGKKDNIIENVRQIYVENKLEPGLRRESIEYDIVCPECQFVKYFQKADDFLYYNRKVFENIPYDIVKSQEKFGEITCSNKIFITQKFYRVIVDNGIGRGLAYVPVMLV